MGRAQIEKDLQALQDFTRGELNNVQAEADKHISWISQYTAETLESLSQEIGQLGDLSSRSPSPTQQHHEPNVAEQVDAPQVAAIPERSPSQNTACTDQTDDQSNGPPSSEPVRNGRRTKRSQRMKSRKDIAPAAAIGKNRPKQRKAKVAKQKPAPAVDSNPPSDPEFDKENLLEDQNVPRSVVDSTPSKPTEQNARNSQPLPSNNALRQSGSSGGTDNGEQDASQLDAEDIAPNLGKRAMRPKAADGADSDSPERSSKRRIDDRSKSHHSSVDLLREACATVTSDAKKKRASTPYYSPRSRKSSALSDDLPSQVHADMNCASPGIGDAEGEVPNMEPISAPEVSAEALAKVRPNIRREGGGESLLDSNDGDSKKGVEDSICFGSSRQEDSDCGQKQSTSQAYACESECGVEADAAFNEREEISNGPGLNPLDGTACAEKSSKEVTDIPPPSSNNRSRSPVRPGNLEAEATLSPVNAVSGTPTQSRGMGPMNGANDSSSDEDTPPIRRRRVRRRKAASGKPTIADADRPSSAAANLEHRRPKEGKEDTSVGASFQPEGLNADSLAADRSSGAQRKRSSGGLKTQSVVDARVDGVSPIPRRSPGKSNLEEARCEDLACVNPIGSPPGLEATRTNNIETELGCAKDGPNELDIGGQGSGVVKEFAEQPAVEAKDKRTPQKDAQGLPSASAPNTLKSGSDQMNEVSQDGKCQTTTDVESSADGVDKIALETRDIQAAVLKLPKGDGAGANVDTASKAMCETPRGKRNAKPDDTVFAAPTFRPRRFNVDENGKITKMALGVLSDMASTPAGASRSKMVPAAVVPGSGRGSRLFRPTTDIYSATKQPSLARGMSVQKSYSSRQVSAISRTPGARAPLNSASQGFPYSTDAMGMDSLKRSAVSNVELISASLSLRQQPGQKSGAKNDIVMEEKLGHVHREARKHTAEPEATAQNDAAPILAMEIETLKHAVPSEDERELPLISVDPVADFTTEFSRTGRSLHKHTRFEDDETEPKIASTKALKRPRVARSQAKSSLRSRIENVRKNKSGSSTSTATPMIASSSGTTPASQDRSTLGSLTGDGFFVTGAAPVLAKSHVPPPLRPTFSQPEGKTRATESSLLPISSSDRQPLKPLTDTEPDAKKDVFQSPKSRIPRKGDKKEVPESIPVDCTKQVNDDAVDAEEPIGKNQAGDAPMPSPPHAQPKNSTDNNNVESLESIRVENAEQVGEERISHPVPSCAQQAENADASSLPSGSTKVGVGSNADRPRETGIDVDNDPSAGVVKDGDCDGHPTEATSAELVANGQPADCDSVAGQAETTAPANVTNDTDHPDMKENDAASYTLSNLVSSVRSFLPSAPALFGAQANAPETKATEAELALERQRLDQERREAEIAARREAQRALKQQETEEKQRKAEKKRRMLQHAERVKEEKRQAKEKARIQKRQEEEEERRKKKEEEDRKKEQKRQRVQAQKRLLQEEEEMRRKGMATKQKSQRERAGRVVGAGAVRNTGVSRVAGAASNTSKKVTHDGMPPPVPKTPVANNTGKGRKKSEGLTSYQMTEKKRNSSDEEDENEYSTRKPIPRWALKANIMEKAAEQADTEDGDLIFRRPQSINLEDTFASTRTRKRRYRNRTSSAAWTHDRLTTREEMEFKQTARIESEFIGQGGYLEKS